MRILRDEIMLCSDCTMVACNGPEGAELLDKEATIKGLALLGPHLAPDFNSETGEGISGFSNAECESCGTTLAGYRAKFAQLGE